MTVITELNKEPAFTEAIRALKNQLPEVAASKLTKLVNTQDAQKNLSVEAYAYLKLALAEALIRSAQLNGDNTPFINKALAILEAADLKELANTPIWKSQALVSLGRYADAVESLAEIVPSSVTYHEGVLLKARIYIAMLRQDEALTVLAEASQSESNVIRNSAYLLICETLISQGNTELALSLFNKLRTNSSLIDQQPSTVHQNLVASSLIETASIYLKQEKPELAAHALSLVDGSEASREIKEKTHLTTGLLLAGENKLKEATEAFAKTRDSANKRMADTATINASITSLKAHDLETFGNIFDTISDESVKTSLQLERALWKISKNDITGREELETFISNQPRHPRELEARIALADSSVNISPYDTELARSQLDITKPYLTTSDQRYQSTLIRIQVEALSQNWAALAEAIDTFIKTSPNDPRKPKLILQQGEAYFNNQDYNQARLAFQEIATSHPESSVVGFADFLNAMSARLVGTTQAKEECISLFQTVIDANDSLSNEARIQQSRVLIDLRKYNEAEACLTPLLEDKTVPSFILADAGILMADCYHRQGSIDASKYEHAIAIYQQLLSQKDLKTGEKNRLYFLKGKTHENMGSKEDALTSYYSVISDKNTELSKPKTSDEWKWFYQCSFQALSMLEKETRWEAAVKLARQIASSNGPRSEEASQRANNLAKKHMIWEDKAPLSAETTSADISE